MSGLLSRLFGLPPGPDPDVAVHAEEVAALDERGRLERERALQTIQAWEADEATIKASLPRDSRGVGVTEALLQARDRGRERREAAQ